MILAGSGEGSLKAALRCWEWFGYASTAIVFLGCLGEFVAEFTPVPKSKEAKHRLALLSLLVLILGIAGELLGAVRTSQLSGQLIANIEERAGEAERKAGEANDRASVNEKEAARLTKEAEAERLARVKIEERLKYRTLTSAQQLSIEAQLRAYAGQKFHMSTYFDDTECHLFFARLLETLESSGWIPVPSSSISSQVLRRGVIVMVHTDVDDKTLQAANDLISLLRAQGISTADVWLMPPGWTMQNGKTANEHDPTIDITVGRKEITDKQTRTPSK